MLVIKNLQKKYQTQFLLEIADLHIRKGEIVGLVGNNGAGKSTLFKLILDIIESDSGEVYISNIPTKLDDAWKKILGVFLDESFLINFLTPDEYFVFINGLDESCISVEQRLAHFGLFFNNEILLKNKLIRNFSKGSQAKIGIASAFLTAPQIIILDEPFAHLDPSARNCLIKLIKYFNDVHKCTFFISSHDLDHITDVCNRIIVIEKGKIISDTEKNFNTFNELKTYFQR